MTGDESFGSIAIATGTVRGDSTTKHSSKHDDPTFARTIGAERSPGAVTCNLSTQRQAASGPRDVLCTRMTHGQVPTPSVPGHSKTNEATMHDRCGPE